MPQPTLRLSIAALMICLGGCSSAPIEAAAQTSRFDQPAWYRASIDSQLSFWFVDAASIHQVGEFKRAWTAYKVGFKADPSALGFDMMKSLVEFDCAQRRSRPLSVRLYDSKGVQLDNEDFSESFKHMMPGTPQTKLLNVVCSEPAEWPKDVERVSGENLRQHYADWIISTLAK